VKWHWYDGTNPGWALILPPANENAAVADLLVFAEDTGASTVVRDVPRRAKGDESGTGHTFRDAK
jgi:hypothetical protein